MENGISLDTSDDSIPVEELEKTSSSVKNNGYIEIPCPEFDLIIYKIYSDYLFSCPEKDKIKSFPRIFHDVVDDRNIIDFKGFLSYTTLQPYILRDKKSNEKIEIPIEFEVNTDQYLFFILTSNGVMNYFDAELFK